MNAVMSYMLADWYRPGVTLDFPKGPLVLGGPALCHHGAQHKKVWPALTIGPDNTFHVDTRAISPE